MYNFNFQYNFSELDLTFLQEKYMITPKEIISVFTNLKKLTEVYEYKTSIFIGAGYSCKNRVILIAFVLTNDCDIQFIGAKLPDEPQLDEFYF